MDRLVSVTNAIAVQPVGNGDCAQWLSFTMLVSFAPGAIRFLSDTDNTRLIKHGIGFEMTSITRINPVSCVLGAALLTIGMSSGALAEEGHGWHYGPNGDDSSWGGVCATGKEQSPIDIPNWNDPSLDEGQVRPITFNYGASGGAEITNNGHSIVVTPKAANTIEIGGETYRLAQFHFHTHSEHLSEGRHYPMEMHLVHVDAAGNPKLVVGIFIMDDLKEGAASKDKTDLAASSLLDRLPLPAHKGDSSAVESDLTVMDLMPVDHGEHRAEHVEFKGSLTTPTPTCSEGLTWIVMGYKLHTTPKVIAKFHDIMGDNYREPQPINGRQISCCGGGETFN